MTPLKKGGGEASLRRDTDDVSTICALSSSGASKSSRRSTSRSPARTKPTYGPTAMVSMVSEVITAVYKNEESSSPGINQRKSKVAPATQLEEQTLPDLMMLVEKRQRYLLFLKDCGMITNERKDSIVQEIDFFCMISSCLNKRTRGSDDLDDGIEDGYENDNSVG